MLKKLLLITLLTLSLYKCHEGHDDEDHDHEDHEDHEEEDNDDEHDDQPISEIDSSEFVTALTKYFESIESDQITNQDATDIILIIYSESTLEEIKAFEEKLINDELLDENEENLLYFKKHVDDYLAEFHTGGEMTKDVMMDLIRDNLILKYLEEKMVEEERLEGIEDGEMGEDGEDAGDMEDGEDLENDAEDV